VQSQDEGDSAGVATGAEVPATGKTRVYELAKNWAWRARSFWPSSRRWASSSRATLRWSSPESLERSERGCDRRPHRRWAAETTAAG